MWGCGLKYCVSVDYALLNHVTPYVGVWIEILEIPYELLVKRVTPYVGVWIEI